MRAVIPIILCLFLTLLPFQATSAGGIKSNSATLTVDELKNGEYLSEFTAGGKVKLNDGVYKEKNAPDSSTELIVTLSNKMAFGDLNGDGEEDAAVVLITDPGGSGTFHFLAVVINQNGSPDNVASQLLGDRVKIKNLSIRSGEIAVEMITHGPSDPLCCPTLETTLDYQLQGDKLVVAPNRSLIDRNWALQSFGTRGGEKRLFPDTEISIEFSADGRFHGSGGCNGYFGSYKISPDGLLSISPVGSTQMACPEEILNQEINYFKALQSVSAFKVKSQVLQLFYENGVRVLNFNESITR